MTLKSDPFLLDYGCVRLNCFVDEQMRLIVVKLSWNREILEEIVCDNHKRDLQTIIDDLLCNEKNYLPCHGFSDQDASGVFDVFYRLRKNDIPYLLLEKYNGSILYRARNCKFVFQRQESDKDKVDIFRNQCEHCKDFYTQMDVKYASGRFTKNNVKLISTNDTKMVKPFNEADSLASTASIHNPEDTLVACKPPETTEALSENDATKRPRRDSRQRKSGSKYKDFVVDLGTTEELNLKENTTSTNDDPNEEIENIENLPLNVQNQEVKICKIKPNV